MRYLIIIALFFSCSHHKYKEKSSPSTERSDLLVKRQNTLVAIAAISDKDTHWPSVTDCDGTLWAGIACAGDVDLDLDLAEYSPGEIHRRPAPSCWNVKDGDVGSKSTISNDQLTGYIWCRWAKEDLDALKRLADYGEKNHWFMGQPTSAVGDVLMKSNLIGLLGRAIFKLSNGTDDRLIRHTGTDYLAADIDYVRHIGALQIALQGETTEETATLLDIDANMMKRLDEYIAAEPSNPLYAAIKGVYTGDMSTAVELLLKNDLPRPSYVRGQNPDAFAMADWLLAAKIVLKRTK